MAWIKALGSLRAAIILIVSLALILAVSTVLESMHGTPFAQRVFYKSPWFDIFLSLFWVNILCSTLSRLPFKKKHTGFVITHVGILLLLVGGFFSRIWGVEGQMTLFEGERKNRLLMEDDSSKTRSPETKVSEGNKNDPANPAVYATLKSQALDFEQSFWLVEKDPGNPHSSFTQIGPATFELKTRDSQTPMLRIRKTGSEVFRVPIEEKMPRPIPLGKDLTISRLAYYPKARIQDGQIVNSADTHFNPAVRFTVQDEKGRTEEHTRFFLFPHFGSLRGGAANNLFDLAVALEMEIPEEFTRPKSPLFVFYTYPGGRWEYRVFSSKTAGAASASPLPVGEPIPTGWMDFSLRVDKILIRAKTARSEPRAVELPFGLELNDFRKIDYPGTNNPASFESDVVLFDPERKLTMEKTISMNRPLDYKGFRVFQSSYIQDASAGEASVFTIAKNPGIGLIYSGAVIILIGVVTLFYIQPFVGGND